MMREIAGPPLPPLPPDAHLLQPVLERAERDPDGFAVGRFVDGVIIEMTAKELKERIWAMAKGLIASGVQPGERVAVMAHTRVEWPMVDYAILAAGGVTVPIYETSSAEQMQWILFDSEAVLVVVETPAMREMFESLGDAVPTREAFVIDAGGLDELEHRGVDVADSEVEARLAGLTTDAMATIIYTSGTTGRPKGCVLTHGNLRTNIFQNLDAIGEMLRDEERSFLFLPLAHSLAKIVLLVGVERGIGGAFATDMTTLAEEMPMARPTMVVSVPRVFEKIWNKSQHKAHAEGKGAIFDKAAEVAIRWSRERLAGHASPWTSFEHALFDRLVYKKIRAAFGGDLRFAFSGGGPLGERLTHFFDGIGVRIFEGYGLTETSPTLTINRADNWKPGTVGPPVAGTTIRIADDGEILAKGPQVFRGYWHNEAATMETFDDDGWFRTGDIGEIDEDGFLKITGRKKELIVTAAGKNVAPAPLEDRLRAHELVSQAVVVGDARPFIAALITVDEEAFGEWAAAHGNGGKTVADMVEDPALRAEVDGAIESANESVSKAEAIKKYEILPHDLSIEAGELTPTLKVRRGIVEKTYADVIERLYSGS